MIGKKHYIYADLPCQNQPTFLLLLLSINLHSITNIIVLEKLFSNFALRNLWQWDICSRWHVLSPRWTKISSDPLSNSKRLCLNKRSWHCMLEISLPWHKHYNFVHTADYVWPGDRQIIKPQSSLQIVIDSLNIFTNIFQ